MPEFAQPAIGRALPGRNTFGTRKWVHTKTMLKEQVRHVSLLAC